jgi:hypothetical protein
MLHELENHVLVGSLVASKLMGELEHVLGFPFNFSLRLVILREYRFPVRTKLKFNELMNIS